jgi:hypothetical protein
MVPSAALRPGRETSTAATVLLSAFATSSVLPSADSATAFGVEPGGAFGKSDVPICSTARRAATSIAQTAFVFAHATKRRAPSGDSAIALGCSPVATSPPGSSVSASKSRTRAPPHDDTNSVLPSRDTRHV